MNWRPDTSEHGLVVSLLVAVCSVAAATALTIPIKEIAPHSRSLFLFVAILFSAWYGGKWPGLCASVLGVLSFDYFLDSHPGAFDLNLSGVIRALVFMACALFVTSLTSQRNEALSNLRKSNRELAKAIDEIRVLRGILPICMHCKQIRNDAGLWQQVERYISEHTDARFSHGICPDCLNKFYPEVAESMSAKNGGKSKPLQYGTQDRADQTQHAPE